MVQLFFLAIGPPWHKILATPLPAHVAAERLAHLEPLPADVALVPLLLLRGLPGLRPGPGEREREPVAAAEVAGPVAAERLERRERAVARLAHELPTGGGGGAARPLGVAVGDGAEGEREGEGHQLVRRRSLVLRHGGPPSCDGSTTDQPKPTGETAAGKCTIGGRGGFG